LVSPGSAMSAVHGGDSGLGRFIPEMRAKIATLLAVGLTASLAERPIAGG
jgi:hypothetical protein